MHIPDGYLGPQTYLTAYGIMAPVWAWASHEVRATLRLRQVPIMALGAAFTFVVMMFNVPIPGGTTGHAVGAVLVAILLGPWAAVVAVSVALAVQALIFGDGGVTAFAANCLNMAVIMPFTGWWTYRFIAGRSPASSKRRWIAAALGSYVGLNAAALSAALMFGIQPALAHDDSGRALYCPFALDVALPAMAVEHLLIFGVVEALATGLVVAYLSRSEPALLEGGIPVAAARGRMPLWKKLALGLGVLVLLAPLGLVIPVKLGASEAWGEWGGERVQELAGYIPAGMQKIEALWRAPLPDYAPKGSEEATLPVLSIWYILSGMLGVAFVAGLFIAARRLIARRETDGIAP
jgi:cobalt/nickel transport system permease protein